MQNDNRRLSKRHIEFIALGGTIGSGLFLGLGQGIALAGPAMLVDYLVAGLMVFVIARALGEMTLETGKRQIFIAHTADYLGRRAALVQGWSYWCCAILVAMAELTGGGLLVHAVLPALPVWLIAFAELIILVAINWTHVRVFGETEFWMALVKIATVCGFILFGLLLIARPELMHPATANISNLISDGGFFPHGWAGMIAALPTALFAFGGTELVGIAAADAEHPEKTIPRATNGLLARILLFYLGSTALILVLMPWRGIPTDTSPMVTILSRTGFSSAPVVMTIVLATSALSACNSVLFGAGRILLTLARLDVAPQGFAKLNDNGAPGRAILLSGMIVSSVILLTFILPTVIFQLLLASAVIIFVANWIFVLLAHLRHRRQHPGPRSFGVPMSPWSNYLTIAFAIGIILLATHQPGFDKGLLLAVAGVVLVGLPAAWIFRRRRASSAGSD